MTDECGGEISHSNSQDFLRVSVLDCLHPPHLSSVHVSLELQYLRWRSVSCSPFQKRVLRLATSEKTHSQDRKSGIPNSYVIVTPTKHHLWETLFYIVLQCLWLTASLIWNTAVLLLESWWRHLLIFFHDLEVILQTCPPQIMLRGLLYTDLLPAGRNFFHTNRVSE